MATTELSEQSELREQIPQLEHGDRLTLSEFRRRYEAMPKLKRAELLRGVVYMQAAVKATQGEPHASLLMWLSHYRANTPLTSVGDNTTLRLSDDCEPQPDAYLRIDHEAGGQSRIDDGYIVGAPELVAEIAVSSVSYDLHDKLKVYQDHGVREYIVWRVDDRRIDWFVLTDGRFQQQAGDESDVSKSRAFPGLWLDIAAMIDDRPMSVLQRLSQGLDTAEHNSFVTRLRAG